MPWSLCLAHHELVVLMHSSLMQDFATHAGALGGGMLDPYLLAPNNALQYSRVLSRIEREIAYDPYIQVCTV